MRHRTGAPNVRRHADPITVKRYASCGQFTFPEVPVEGSEGRAPLSAVFASVHFAANRRSCSPSTWSTAPAMLANPSRE